MTATSTVTSTIGALSPPGPRPDGASGSEPGRQVTTEEYRQLMTGFPTGVAVVTSLTGDGHPRGLTCTSLTSVTLHPPTLLVSLRTGSITLAAIRECGRFAVNLLHTGGQPAARVFAAASADRFDQVAWRPSSQLGLPWLVEDAFAVAECAVTGSLRVGGHTVLFGEVVAVAHEPGTPLLYGFRRYAGWSGLAAAVEGAEPPAGAPNRDETATAGRPARW